MISVDSLIDSKVYQDLFEKISIIKLTDPT